MLKGLFQTEGTAYITFFKTNRLISRVERIDLGFNLWGNGCTMTFQAQSPGRDCLHIAISWLSFHFDNFAVTQRGNAGAFGFICFKPL